MITKEGSPGPPGPSAYELAVSLGYEGSLADWIASLHGGGEGISSWSSITGKPETFTPSAHTHAQSDITGLESALEAKANNADLAAVAKTGAYSSLSGKPSLATVATTGSYNDLTDKPSGGGGGGVSSWDDLEDKPEFADVAFSGDYEDLINTPSGGGGGPVGWNDITGKPTFGTAAAQDTSAFATAAQGSKADSAYEAINDIEEILAPVAFSGDYDDLINKPSGGGGTTLPSQTGNAGKFLKTTGSALQWATPPSGGGGGPTENVVTIQPDSYDSSAGDYILVLPHAETGEINLPASPTHGDKVKVAAAGWPYEVTFFGLISQDDVIHESSWGETMFIYLEDVDLGYEELSSGWTAIGPGETVTS